MSAAGSSPSLRDAPDFEQHVLQLRRIQRHEPWRGGERLDSLRQLVGRYGADMTQILSQDDVWSSLNKALLVETIEPFTGTHELFDDSINRVT